MTEGPLQAADAPSDAGRAAARRAGSIYVVLTLLRRRDLVSGQNAQDEQDFLRSSNVHRVSCGAFTTSQMASVRALPNPCRVATPHGSHGHQSMDPATPHARRVATPQSPGTHKTGTHSAGSLQHFLGCVVALLSV